MYNNNPPKTSFPKLPIMLNNIAGLGGFYIFDAAAALGQAVN